MSDRKNKYKRGNHKRNPRRGPPGVLLTCERGREAKCTREGLDILRYYLSHQSDNKTTESSVEKKKELTLDEEIAMLQKGATSDQVLDGKTESQQNERQSKAFTVYDTGCGGTVVVMCTLPGSALIPLIRTEWKEANDAKRKAAEDGTEEPNAPKRARLEEDTVGTAEDDKEVGGTTEIQELGDKTRETESNAATPPWDPVDTVDRVLHDLDSSCKTAPSSRFVTRMIPIQATCFPSVEEIRLTAKALIQKYLQNKPPSTFAVRVKRRNCCTATRDEIITAVAGQVIEMEGCAKNEWKVNLKSPEYTILVEVCQTLCGITIVKECAAYRNFNLLEIREAQENTATDD